MQLALRIQKNVVWNKFGKPIMMTRIGLMMTMMTMKLLNMAILTKRALGLLSRNLIERTILVMA